MLARLRDRFINDLAVDLGVATTKVYVRDQGIVAREPTVVAVDKGTGKISACGWEAVHLPEDGGSDVTMLSPFRDGFLVEPKVTEAMLRHAFSKAHYRVKLVRPRVVLAVPTDVGEVEKQALKRAACAAGAKEVHLINKSMAAAIGVGLPVQDAAGNMIIDIGGGTTEVALISLSGIVVGRSIRVGGEQIDRAIVDYMRRAYNLAINPRAAEDIKIKIGSAYPPENPGGELTMEIEGFDLVYRIPHTNTITITSQEVREAISEPVNQIVDCVRAVLERCPPELAADLEDRGLILAGGGALLRGLDELLKRETGPPVHIVDDPLSAVAEGAGKVLHEIRFLRQFGSEEDDLRKRPPCEWYAPSPAARVGPPESEMDFEDPGDP